MVKKKARKQSNLLRISWSLREGARSWKEEKRKRKKRQMKEELCKLKMGRNSACVCVCVCWKEKENIHVQVRSFDSLLLTVSSFVRF